MKVQVKRGFVEVNNNSYFSPKLCHLEGVCVDVSVWCDDEVDVYVDGKFYCEAAYYAGRTAVPPMKDEFPPVPEAYRCRSAIRSEDLRRREMRRTARRYHQMRQGTVENKEKTDIRPVLISIREGLDSVIRLLNEEAEGKI